MRAIKAGRRSAGQEVAGSSEAAADGACVSDAHVAPSCRAIELRESKCPIIKAGIIL